MAKEHILRMLQVGRALKSRIRNLNSEAMKINVKVLLLGLALIINSCDKNDDEIIDTNDAAIIYSGVHDPAQLVEVNGELVLFASAVEWSTYEFGSNNWELKGDDIYANGSPSWYNGSNLWAPSVFKTSSGELRLYHSAVTDEDKHQSKIGFASVNTSVSNFTFTTSSDYVIESQNTEQPFAIDPAVFEDDSNRIWLVLWLSRRGYLDGRVKRNNRTA